MQNTKQILDFSKQILIQAVEHSVEYMISTNFICFQAKIDELYDLAATEFLYLPEKIHNASQKRQREFVAGRLLAQSQLFNHFDCDLSISSSLQKLPIWPHSYLGCISHNHTEVVVGLGQKLNYLGIDIEEYIASDFAYIKKMIVHPNEEIIFRDLQEHLGEQKTLTLFFSMKESLYKAIYPKVRQHVDFLQVDIIGYDLLQSLIKIRIESNFQKRFALEDIYIGGWICFESSILTWVVDKKLD